MKIMKWTAPLLWFVITGMNGTTSAVEMTPTRQTYEKAERDAARTAAQIHGLSKNKTPDPTRLTELSAKLRAFVKLAFDSRLQLQRAELDEIEAALRMGRERLAQRERNANAIIERRVEELRSGQDLSWLPTHQDNLAVVSTTSSKQEIDLEDKSILQGSFSSYQVFLRDEIGALKYRREERMRGLAECEQRLIDLQSDIDASTAGNTEERRRAVHVIDKLHSQIRELRQEVSTIDEKMVLLQKKLLDTHQQNLGFEAISGVVKQAVDGRIELAVGAQSGVIPGMRLSVFRDGRFVNQIKIVEVGPDLCTGVASKDGRGAIQTGDTATFLLDPRLPRIVGAEPGEPIYNEKIKRFKFRLSQGVGDPAEVGATMMRRYLGDASRPKIYGIWGDPANESVIVIAPPESETAIREFLVKNEVMQTTGFDLQEEDSLEQQRDKLLIEKQEMLLDLANCQRTIIDLDAVEAKTLNEQSLLVEKRADLTKLQKKLRTLDQKLSMYEKLISSSNTSLSSNGVSGE